MLQAHVGTVYMEWPWTGKDKARPEYGQAACLSGVPCLTASWPDAVHGIRLWSARPTDNRGQGAPTDYLPGFRITLVQPSSRLSKCL